ncbi:TPA: GNAT family N-acetyltransferase [Candidatus Poribacteria bacterium]|nr:GNAT family N-acetyltransferase [Candidatus Poribacteria bacterium]
MVIAKVIASTHLDFRSKKYFWGNDMLIRKAKADEIERICSVDVAAFLNSPYGEKTHMAENKESQQKRWDNAKRFCQEHLDWVYVAIEDDNIVGFATLEYQPQQQTGRVQNNAVLPEYRCRGISTALVSRVLEELKNLGAKRINVHTKFVPAARRVYEKVGFSLSQKDEDYYYEGRWIP